MSLKTTGSIEADSYKATVLAAQTPGFVTNDASGLFEYGQSGASTPIGASIWDFLEHQVVPAETNCLTFAGLSGNANKIYKLVFRNLLIPSVLEITDSSNYVSGEDLVVGETVSGGTSGATGIVDSFVPAAVGFPGSVLVIRVTAGTFVDGEVVTGLTSAFAVTIAGGGQFFPDVHYTLRPNGVTTGQKTTFRINTVSVAPVFGTFPEMTIVSAQNSQTSGVIYLFARTGKARSFYSDSSSASLSVVTRVQLYSSHGLWTDTAANITSLDVCSSLVNSGLPAGAEFTLYKMNS
jgi:hypothetical protein